MKRGIATMNITGGKWVRDYLDKKTYTKVCNRKVCKESKKICKNHNID